VEGTTEQVDKALELLRAALLEAFPPQKEVTVGMTKSNLPFGGQSVYHGGGAGGGAKRGGGGGKRGGGAKFSGQRRPPLGSAAAE